MDGREKRQKRPSAASVPVTDYVVCIDSHSSVTTSVLCFIESAPLDAGKVHHDLVASRIEIPPKFDTLGIHRRIFVRSRKEWPRVIEEMWAKGKYRVYQWSYITSEAKEATFLLRMKPRLMKASKERAMFQNLSLNQWILNRMASGLIDE